MCSLGSKDCAIFILLASFLACSFARRLLLRLFHALLSISNFMLVLLEVVLLEELLSVLRLGFSADDIEVLFDSTPTFIKGAARAVE